MDWEKLSAKRGNRRPKMEWTSFTPFQGVPPGECDVECGGGNRGLSRNFVASGAGAPVWTVVEKTAIP
jgi:hypothetical protein